MSLRKWVKRVGRKAAPVAYKVGRVVTPVVAAAGSLIGGPVVGAAISGIGGSAGYYARATAARAGGTRGRAARELGRGERRRQFIYGMVGTGVGSLGSGAYTAAAGGTFGQSVAAAGLGQGGAELFGAGGTVFSKAGATLGPSVATPGAGGAAPTLAWQTINGVPVYAPVGISAPIPGTTIPAGAAAAMGGSSITTTEAVLGALGAGNTVYDTVKKVMGGGTIPGNTPPGKDPNTNSGGYDGSNGNPWGTINARGGQDGPGMSPAMIAALVLVGVLVMAG